MTLFEQHTSIPQTHPDYNLHEREFYVALILSREELQDRWARIGYSPYKPEYKQLKLEL